MKSKVVSMDGEYTHIAINCEYTERLDLENIHRLLHLNKSEVEFVKDLGVIPIFDNYFNKTRRIFLTDKVAYEYIKVHTQNYFKRG